MHCNMYFVLQIDPIEGNEGVLQASEPVFEEVQQRVKKEDPQRRGSVRVTLFPDYKAKLWEQG